MKPAREVRLLLGDQLNIHHSWFSKVDEEVLYVLMEIRSETDYAWHHIQKVVSFFLAMRAFGEELQKQGHRVHYIKLDDAENQQSFEANLKKVLQQTQAKSWSYQLPDEYRLDELLKKLVQDFSLPCEPADTEHFITSRNELREFFKGKKQYLMENFYRAMRRKHGVLMDGDQPVMGQWNYDASNRKKLPAKHPIPSPKTYPRDVTELVEMLKNQDVKTLGSLEPECFVWPVTRAEGLDLLSHFTTHLLPEFGTYQDALTTRDWSLFHSRLSFVMNAKLVHPMEVIRAVEDVWKNDPNRVTIAQAEGFIRQILGWREYMRGVYWAQMPEFATLNFFGHERPLPGWFWTGKTRMKCLSHTITQSLEKGYAHHIQRLMVTGNFALLAGIDPSEVDAWYLGIYVDALEWVEITNTRGMSQFADGGIVGSKPYVSSANYIHKMSDYCGQCAYDHKQRTGENACPFNSLYWHFLARNRELLGNNPRMGMMYRNWDKQPTDLQQDLLQHADEVLENLENL